MNAEEKVYDIIDGPSKSTLFDACRFVCNKNVDFNLHFEVVSKHDVSSSSFAYAVIPVKDVKIFGIQHEDGSGDSFNLVGYCSADLEYNAIPEFKPYRFEIYFNTKKRIGTIRFGVV